MPKGSKTKEKDDESSWAGYWYRKGEKIRREQEAKNMSLSDVGVVLCKLQDQIAALQGQVASLEKQLNKRKK